MGCTSLSGVPWTSIHVVTGDGAPFSRLAAVLRAPPLLGDRPPPPGSQAAPWLWSQQGAQGTKSDSFHVTCKDTRSHPGDFIELAPAIIPYLHLWPCLEALGLGIDAEILGETQFSP